ncbi:carbohydrate porin [Aestuariivirga sp.]|jgi:porin|uniref:carbohydrate porin n=1 Tax=Aestuariivirga sp. TaxID=2650926 RepID=UPI003782EDBF
MPEVSQERRTRRQGVALRIANAMRGVGATGLGLAASLAAAAAAPAGSSWFDDWVKGSSALGNWGGQRQTLEDSGLSFSGFSVTALLGNTSGGTRQSWAPANSTMAAMNVDFGKMLGWTGFLIHAEGWLAGGSDMSTTGRIDNLFNVASAYTTDGAYLGQLYAQQKLFDDKLQLQLGRMSTANNFAELPVVANYASMAMNSVPLNLPLNTVPFTSYPSTQRAAVATLVPMPEFKFTTGVYSADEKDSELKGTGGIDFNIDLSDGMMVIGQITYLHQQAKNDSGLPGTYFLGAFYASDSYSRLDGKGGSGPKHLETGNYGFYVMGQQMVYREGGAGSSQGMTSWLSLTLQPDESINQMPLMLAGGASYEGLFPGRPADTTAFAVYYGKLSNDIENTTAETVFELNHTFWATPWLGITPDFQYILDPNGDTNRADVVVIGGQLMVNF